MTLRAPSIIVAGLLVAAAVGALALGGGTSTVGRMGASTAAIVLLAVAAGAFVGRPWAQGAAFFLGLFWFWAAIALTLQQRFTTTQTAGWVAWSLAVMASSVRARGHA